MIDYKDIGRPHLPRKVSYWTAESIATLAAFAAMLACFTLMGWSCVEREASLPLTLQPETLKAHNEYLESKMYEFNRKQEIDGMVRP